MGASREVNEPGVTVNDSATQLDLSRHFFTDLREANCILNSSVNFK